MIYQQEPRIEILKNVITSNSLPAVGSEWSQESAYFPQL